MEIAVYGKVRIFRSLTGEQQEFYIEQGKLFIAQI